MGGVSCAIGRSADPPTFSFAPPTFYVPSDLTIFFQICWIPVGIYQFPANHIKTAYSGFCHLLNYFYPYVSVTFCPTNFPEMLPPMIGNIL